MIEEELLLTWLKINSKIRNHRYVKSMAYNEALILGILYHRQKNCDNYKLWQLKDLCQETGILKSALNRIVNGLEKKQYIERIKQVNNKKAVYLSLTPLAIETYEKMHNEVLVIVKQFIDSFGTSKTSELITLLNDATSVFEKNILKTII